MLSAVIRSTARSKRSHRQAECGLLLAERLATMAQAWVGQPAPAERLRTLWHDLCFNQFHDTLGGSSTKEAEDEAIMSLGRVIMGSREIADDAGRAIAARVNTAGAGGTVVLFNPSAEPVSEYVEYEPWTEWQLWGPNGWGLTDEAGRAVPHQLIETHEALTRATSGISRLVFRAELPAFGYRVYRFAPGAPVIEPVGAAQATETGLENDLFALRLNPATGDIVSCIDKASGLELVGPGGWNVAQVLEDTSDTWSHRVARFDQVIGAFGDAKITVYERGPLEASLLVERRYEGNVWLQQIVVRHGDPQIMIRNWLNWQGQWRMLKLAFDVPTDVPQAAHDVAFGWCARPTNGQEFPTHMWMDVSGPARAGDDRTIGLAVLNDGKYSCDVSGSTARLTILRCPPYAYHEPHVFGTRARYDWVDQGYQEFTVALRPHIGDWRDAGVDAGGAAAERADPAGHDALPRRRSVARRVAAGPIFARNGVDGAQARRGRRRLHRSHRRSAWSRRGGRTALAGGGLPRVPHAVRGGDAAPDAARWPVAGSAVRHAGAACQVIII